VDAAPPSARYLIAGLQAWWVSHYDGITGSTGLEVATRAVEP
jgi:hypothetical protein